VGLPARHVYGLRIAKSELGYKSLGVATDKATKGQHCRVEVYRREHGWAPVDFDRDNFKYEITVREMN